MSYDLAFWDAPPPGDDVEAAATYKRLRDAIEAGGTGAALTPGIDAFVSDLENRWPDDDDDDTPWASMPIRGDAHGPFVYLCLRYGRPPGDIESIVAIARSHRLVCYDPQFSQVV